MSICDASYIESAERGRPRKFMQIGMLVLFKNLSETEQLIVCTNIKIIYCRLANAAKARKFHIEASGVCG